MKSLVIFILIVLMSGCGQKRGFEYDLVISNVSLIDGTGQSMRPDSRVWVKDGRVARIGAGALSSAANAVDGSGKYLIPGLIDAHVHFPPDRTAQAAIAARLLEYGVTTVLNPGAQAEAGVALRERINSGEVPGPRVLTAGRIIDLAPSGDGLEHWGALVTSQQSIREEVRAQARQGVDFIKLYRGLPPALVQAAVEEAHLLHLPVIGHMGATGWTEGARLGVDMLVHSGYGTPMDEIVNLEDPQAAPDDQWYRAYADAPNGARFKALVEALVNNKTVVVPTLSITQASGLGKDAALLPLFRTDLAPEANLPDWWGEGWRERHPQHGDVSEEEAELLERVYFPGVLAILRAYSERGVRLAIGTDVGNAWMTPGYIYHYELQLFQQAGIQPMKILSMATRGGAEALGIAHEIGTIEVGKWADFVLLNDNPLDDIKNTLSIEAVFKGGELLIVQ